jgi:hypothetical protein
VSIYWANLILNGISFISSYIIFYILCRDIKIIKWASQKSARAVGCILIALIFYLTSMSVIRNIDIQGIYYSLLDGLLLGLFVSVAVTISLNIKRA